MNMKRLSVAEVKQLLGGNIPNPVKGFIPELFEGDEISFGEIFLVSADGKDAIEDNEAKKGAYWVSECTIVRGGKKVRQDVSAAALVRAAGARSHRTLADKIRENATSTKEVEVLTSRELLADLGKKLSLEASVMSTTDALYEREGALDKLQNLKGRILRIVKVSPKGSAWTLRFNRKEEDAWGSKPEHFAPVRILFFEEVAKTSKKSK